VRVLDRNELDSDEGPARQYALAAQPRAGRYELPLSFSLVPDQDKHKDFRVIVTGLSAGEPVVEQQAIVTFQPRKAQLLRVFLAGTCLQVLCRDQDGQRTGSACKRESGNCNEVTESTDLPVWSGRASEFDDDPRVVDAGLGDSSETGAGKIDAGEAVHDSGDDLDVNTPPTGIEASIPPVDGGGAQTGEAGGGGAGCGNCALHASCTGPAGAQRCTCDAPYEDDNAGGCVTPICTAMPCQNGGTCNKSGATRSCDCSGVDYQGASCETKIDDCATNPCAHGGTCTDGVRTYTCLCVSGSGFAGSACNDNINECATSNVCSGTRNTVSFNYPCVDSTGAVAGYSCTGQYPDWAPPPAGASRFTTSAGVVSDSHTGLRWEQAMTTTPYSLAAARAYCAGITLAPGSGWRVPTRAELISIVDYPKAAAPAIDTSVFSGTPNTFVWTNSMSVMEPGFAWYINFEFGNASTVDAEGTWYVRCVR
jgi:hypothetical protein